MVWIFRVSNCHSNRTRTFTREKQPTFILRQVCCRLIFQHNPFVDAVSHDIEIEVDNPIKIYILSFLFHIEPYHEGLAQIFPFKILWVNVNLPKAGTLVYSLNSSTAINLVITAMLVTYVYLFIHLTNETTRREATGYSISTVHLVSKYLCSIGTNLKKLYGIGIISTCLESGRDGDIGGILVNLRSIFQHDAYTFIVTSGTTICRKHTLLHDLRLALSRSEKEEC
ncbi:MAG: hypothetical protein PUJ24_09240 [Bacteroidales bacterium]|nr:hypothetical protein [Bacteroidales bacterium]